MKAEFARDYNRRLRLILRSNLNGKNKKKNVKQLGRSNNEIWCWSVRIEI